MNYFYLVFSLLFFFGLILSKNPIYSLLSLIGVFFVYAFLFLSLGLELIGFLTIFIYIGAICILFLFVIMFLEIPFLESSKETKVINLIKLPYLLFLVFIVSSFFFNLKLDNAEISNFSLLYKLGDNIVSDNLVQVGNILYNKYGIGVLLSAIILLVAMIAAISICTVLG